MATERDIFSESFTGEHSNLADIVRSGRQQLADIDYQLDKLPKSPQPTLTPMGSRDNNFADQTRTKLLKQKEDIHKTVGSAVYQQVREAKPEIRDAILSKSAYLMDQTNTHVDKARSQDSRHFDQSFDRMEFLRDNYKEQKDLKASSSFEKGLISGEQSTKVPDREEPAIVKDELSSSERFNILLVSTMAEKEIDPDKTVDDIGKSDQEPPEPTLE